MLMQANRNLVQIAEKDLNKGTCQNLSTKALKNLKKSKNKVSFIAKYLIF
jgi:hypothetical protein